MIVPLSTLGNWQREFEAWTDLNVIVYHGSSASRCMLQEYDMYYKDEKVQWHILMYILLLFMYFFLELDSYETSESIGCYLSGVSWEWG